MTAHFLPGGTPRRRKETDRKAALCPRAAPAAFGAVPEGAQPVTYTGASAARGVDPGRSPTARLLPWPSPRPRSSPLFP